MELRQLQNALVGYELLCYLSVCAGLGYRVCEILLTNIYLQHKKTTKIRLMKGNVDFIGILHNNVFGLSKPKENVNYAAGK